MPPPTKVQCILGFDCAPLCLLPFPFADLPYPSRDWTTRTALGICKQGCTTHLHSGSASTVVCCNLKITSVCCTTVKHKTGTFRGQTAMNLGSLSLIILRLLKENSSKENSSWVLSFHWKNKKCFHIFHKNETMATLNQTRSASCLLFCLSDWLVLATEVVHCFIFYMYFPHYANLWLGNILDRDLHLQFMKALQPNSKSATSAPGDHGKVHSSCWACSAFCCHDCSVISTERARWKLAQLSA